VFGYGKILDVDLSSGHLTKRDIAPKFAEEYVGGMGFSCKILYDEVEPSVDPLGPENIIVFAAGPLTGTQAPCAGRIEVTSKSPLTDNIGTGNTGGFWGARLKHAGYDLLIVRGMARKPVYLWIDDDIAELRDASQLWGRDAKEVSNMLAQELSPSNPSKVSVLTIGTAGENLVKFACTLNDYHHVAARNGSGAVLGSKKLKAIAVRGTKPVEIAHPEAFRQVLKEARAKLNAATKANCSNSPVKFVLDPDPRKGYVNRGTLAGRNFQTAAIPNWLEKMGVEAAYKYINRKESTCYTCPVSCFDLAEVNEGKYAGTKANRGTHPGVVMDFGAKCALDNLPAVWKCKELCQNYGLDYASTAGVIAFAQELFQRGKINTMDTGGLELTWGNEDAVIEMIHRIARREDFGNVLAEGSTKAAKIIGNDAEKYVMAIKGMEIMSSDPRPQKRGFDFGVITNPRGGDNLKGMHNRADAHFSKWLPDNYDMFEDERKQIYHRTPDERALSWEGKTVMTKWFEDLYSVINSLGVCFFPAGMHLAFGPTFYSKMYSACTGRVTSPQEIMKLGEKVFNLLKACTVREGFNRKDDCWPDRFYSEPMSDGPSKGAVLSRVEMDGLLDEYYELRGWDREIGVPTAQTLRGLGLDNIAADLLSWENIREE